MNQRFSLVGAASFVWAISMIAGGCSTDTQVPSNGQTVSHTSNKAGLEPNSLPNLAHMTDSVRAQIDRRYSALLTAIENPQTTQSELSDLYGAMGNVLMAAQFIDAPEAFYLNAQTLSPSDGRWPYYLGQLYVNQGEFIKAEAAFRRALSFRPEDVPTLISLGEAYLAQGQPEMAEPLFAQALSREPGSVWSLMGLGRAALARRDYTQAVGHLEEALQVDPDAAGIHYPLAMAYRSLGELGKAEIHLQQRDNGTVRQPDPLVRLMRESLRSASTYEREGIQALESGDWEAAATAFRRGIELDPVSPSLRHRLGTALMMKGDSAEGLAQFEGAVRIAPEYAQAHYSLGLLMEESGRYEEARYRFSAAVQYEPTYVEARLRLARLLRRIGHPGDALSEYAQVIAIDPRLPEAPFGRAMALTGVGRYQDARDQLIEARTLYPDQPMFAKALARLLAAAPDAQVRDGQQALTLVEELLERQRDFDLGEVMAMALAEVGQYMEAVSWQREVMSMAQQVGRDDLVQRMAENLRLYEREQPCRTPWRDDEMP